MIFGDFEINVFVEQRFRLDGGTMFGVVPKVIWNHLLPADDNNLIPMQANIFVLRAHGKVMIFDTGLGDTLSERECKVYGTDGKSNLTAGLAKLGVTPEQVDYVILSHLHTDHSAGAVKREGDQYVPRFPKARHIIEKREWTAAFHPDERTSAVYIPERLRVLEEADLIDFIDGTTELFPGIRAHHTGGHSDGHFSIEMSSGDQQIWYTADIYPTIHHLKTAYVPATDVYPLVSMGIKRKLLPKIIGEQIILAFDHDTSMPFARLQQIEHKFSAVPVAAI